MKDELKERIEKNANLVLWCVHVAGPNDIHAARTHAEAVADAEKMNQAIWSHDKALDDVLCFAFADVWPWSAEKHADDLKRRPQLP